MSTVAVPSERGAPKEMSGPLLGMVLFVASEAMFFAAFFGAYFTIRASQPVWPPKGVPHLKIEIAAVLTVILISSSAVLQVAVRAMRTSGPRRANILLAVTIAMGVAFLALQLYDYSKLGFGVKDGVFGTLFYVMTGIHMAHVFGGAVFLGVVFSQSASGMLAKGHHESLEAATLYWHFVDVVWICLFTVFYLLTPR